MKNLQLILILMLFVFTLNAQTKDIELIDNSADFFPPLLKSFAVSSGAYLITYEIVFKKTNFTQNQCRLIGTGAALLTSYLYSFTHPQNNKYLQRCLYGGLLASFTITVSIGFDRKRDAKRELIEL
jgi:hypothetical protein